MTTYVVLRGASVICVRAYAHKANAVAQGPTARVEARRGRHPRWTDRAWWRDFAARHARRQP